MRLPGASMQVSPTSRAEVRRRLVLGGAFAIGLMLAIAPHPDNVLAAGGDPLVVTQGDAPSRPPATPKSPSDSSAPNAPASAVPLPAPPTPPVPAVTPPAPPAADATDDDTENDEEATPSRKGRVTVDNHGIVVEKGNKRVRVQGL